MIQTLLLLWELKQCGLLNRNLSNNLREDAEVEENVCAAHYGLSVTVAIVTALHDEGIDAK